MNDEPVALQQQIEHLNYIIDLLIKENQQLKSILKENGETSNNLISSNPINRKVSNNLISSNPINGKHQITLFHPTL